MLIRSPRPMPKRPCAALISPDDTTIFSADKFGDVYTLPLIPSEASEVAVPASSTPTPAAQKPWKPEATNLTVHSRRNLEALKQQQLQAARQSSTQDQPEKPTFEHTLIIGHVSLLTDMCFAEKDGRRYILTADRDEHIRLSRYIPQAHIIESFCLGHKNFITAMAVPAGRPELLVSGGGDDELFLWDWLANKVVSKFNLLSAAQKFQEGTSKIAVSQIHTAAAVDAQGGPITAVLVICEGYESPLNSRLASSRSNKPAAFRPSSSSTSLPRPPSLFGQRQFHSPATPSTLPQSQTVTGASNGSWSQLTRAIRAKVIRTCPH